MKPSSGAKFECNDCQHWWPYHILPRFGLCKKQGSSNYEKVMLGRREPCGDFRERLHDERECEEIGNRFCWCETCHETFYVMEVTSHEGHKVYCGVAVINEDSPEFTLAGD